jgi:hypothetical protein
LGWIETSYAATEVTKLGEGFWAVHTIDLAGTTWSAKVGRAQVRSGDRQVRAVAITAKGLELFDAAHVAAEPLAERPVSVLGPGEAEQLTDLLTRFTSQAEE